MITENNQWKEKSKGGKTRDGVDEEKKLRKREGRFDLDCSA